MLDWVLEFLKEYGLYLLGVSSQWIDVAVAAVLIAAAIIDVLSRRGHGAFHDRAFAKRRI